MDHQWRSMPMPIQMPPQPANLCPVCSVPHFPFCPPYPPPPLYNQAPRFPPPPHDYYPRHDPYHPATPPAPYLANPTHGWYQNPTFDHRGGGGGFGQPLPQPPMYDYGYRNGFNNNNNNVEEVDRSYKRARIDEAGQGVFGHENSQIPTRVNISDDERRLKLIRDHGGANDLIQNDVNDVSGNWRDHQPLRGHGATDHVSNDYQTPGVPNWNENRVFSGQPPLPSTPPPPLPSEPPLPPSSEFVSYSSPPKTSFSLFPVPVSTSEWQTSSKHSMGDGRNFLPKQLSPDKPIVFDASQLLKQPYRTTRPDRFVIILRGLPGSGKSYFAKMIRDLEVENGGNAPRIHSMDDYFMTEVEKVDESDNVKPSGQVRGKKPTVKKVMEYCYEPEMEEVYRSSMLKAFKKTLEEGNFTVVIVDDRNLRVADFAQFWAIAKRLGYESYLLEAAYRDPAGCAARNIHGFTLDDIQRMAGQWEEAPLLYMRLNIKSLFHGDDLKESGIQEVDMDTEDGNLDKDQTELPERMSEKTIVPPAEDDPHALPMDGKKWDADEDHTAEGVKELSKSKWSEDLYENETEGTEGMKGNINALSGLIQAYKKQGKSVHWSDQGGNTGFSIGAAMKMKVPSLVIGPGAGYNLKSNPLPKEENPGSSQGIGKSRKNSMFQEQLRAERESFKAVFDRRRQRIGVLDNDDES